MAAGNGGDAGDTVAATLDGVFVYPVKACAGFRLATGAEWPLDALGLRYDRAWRVVCADGEGTRVVTQRECPRLAL
eukprot:gene6498-21208_t